MAKRNKRVNAIEIGIIVCLCIICFPIALLYLLITGRLFARNNFKQNINQKSTEKSFEDECLEIIEEQGNYHKKESLCTNYEMYFYNILEEAFGTDYKVQSQVNLASVVDKTMHSKYRNELFRNIDFGIFDKESLKPLLLIEINDVTHKNYDRYQRDLKVREILKQSKLNLITFYTNYENKKDYIIKRIKKNLM